MNNNLLYRGTYADARELIVEIVQELTKVPFLQRATDEKDKDGKVVMERDWDKDSDAKYVKRALAAAPQVTFDQVQGFVTKRARGYTKKDAAGNTVQVPALQVDIKVRERKPPGPKKLAQKYKDVALEFLLGKKSLAKLNKVLAGSDIVAFEPLAGKPIDSPENVEALGWKCKAFQEAQDAFKGM